jgi:hypothetical protein
LIFSRSSWKNQISKKSQKNIGLFTDLQVVFRMLKPAKIKHYILKLAVGRFARLKASPFALLRSSAFGDVLRTAGLPAAF